MQLGQFLNEHVSNGVLRTRQILARLCRWSPRQLTADLATFNDRVQLLWKGNDDSALAALDQSIKNRQLFPGAGSSFPSVLMYLREPNRFAIWTTATIAGLRALTGSSGGSKVGGSKSYLQFCELVNQFRALHDVAPQEVDAILADASRIKPSPPADPPVHRQPTATWNNSRVLAPCQWRWSRNGSNCCRARSDGHLLRAPWTARPTSRASWRNTSPVTRPVPHRPVPPLLLLRGLRRGTPTRPQIRNWRRTVLCIHPGLFQDLCTDAAGDKDNSTFVLIIDELNRATSDPCWVSS